MEHQIRISITPKKFIYCTLNETKPNSDKLVILVHGLFDNELSQLIFNAAHFFCDSGYTACRLNFYHFKPDSRHFSECTLSQHSKDLKKVIDYFKDKYKSISLVGHSFGGLTILKANLKNITSVSLWEPSSFISYPPNLYIKYNSKIKKYIFRTGYDIIVEKKFMNDLINYPNELELIRKIKCPIQIAYADGAKGGQIESSIRYFGNISHSKKNLLPIYGASHSFREESVEKKLYSETTKWFNSF